MSVTLFFGLPGCGKTTLLTKLAIDAVNSGKFENVYSNVKITVPGVTIITNECIGKYALRNCLLLIDEATIFADNRSYKSFDQGKLIYFLEHRHFHSTVFLFTQQYNGVDLKLRTITERVYYVFRDALLPWWITRYYQIPYGIIIPDPKTTPDKLGDIVQGYCKPNLFIRLFAPAIWRPKYYNYFNSFEEPKGYPDLPPHYFVNSRCVGDKGYLKPREYEKALCKYKLSNLYKNVKHRCLRFLSIFTKNDNLSDRK